MSSDWLEVPPISAKQYKDLYLSEFRPDDRFNSLCDRLQKYYIDAPDSMSNKDAVRHWMLFNKWCNEYGFSRDEINKAKTARRYDY